MHQPEKGGVLAPEFAEHVCEAGQRHNHVAPMACHVDCGAHGMSQDFKRTAWTAEPIPTDATGSFGSPTCDTCGAAFLHPRGSTFEVGTINGQRPRVGQIATYSLKALHGLLLSLINYTIFTASVLKSPQL